jgi:type III restriction enzyme
MKLRFKEQQYQLDAVNAITRVFGGQTKGQRTEVVGRSGLFVDEIFSNKKLEITESDIVKNVQELQREQGINPIQNLSEGFNFSVEMETGTGKTYVYTHF